MFTVTLGYFIIVTVPLLLRACDFAVLAGLSALGEYIRNLSVEVVNGSPLPWTDAFAVTSAAAAAAAAAAVF